MFKRLVEEYEYLWEWLLNKGIFVALIIINAFILTCFMVVFIFALLFSGKH